MTHDTTPPGSADAGSATQPQGGAGPVSTPGAGWAGGPYQPPAARVPFGAVREPGPKLPWARAVSVTAVVFLVAGVLAGWAWQQFAPLAQYKVDEQGGALGEEQMTRVFGPDGTFVSIGFVAAFVLGGALFWWLRDYGPWSVAVVAIGSTLGAGVAWGVGMLLGHDPLKPRLEAAKPGDLVAAPLELHTWTPLAAWLVGAALATAIIAATTWRNEADETRPVHVASNDSPQVH